MAKGWCVMGMGRKQKWDGSFANRLKSQGTVGTVVATPEIEHIWGSIISQSQKAQDMQKSELRKIATSSGFLASSILIHHIISLPLILILISSSSSSSSSLSLFGPIRCIDLITEYWTLVLRTMLASSLNLIISSYVMHGRLGLGAASQIFFWGGRGPSRRSRLSDTTPLLAVD